MGDNLAEMGDRLLLVDELRKEESWDLDNFTEEWAHDEPEDRPEFDSLAGRAADEIERLREAGAKVVEAFDLAYFVRGIERDGDSAWAIKLFPYLRAIAALHTQDAAAPLGPPYMKR